MGRVLTNNISLAYAIEASLATLPGSPTWKLLEPNDISTFGATISTVSRQPISKNRQRKKGTTTDLESAAEFEHDLTREVFIDFAEAFVFAQFTSVVSIASGTPGGTLAADSDIAGAGTEGFTHAALTAALPANTLIYTRGFTQTAANGLFVVDGTNSTTTVTDITTTPGIIDEIPTQAQHATLEVAGRRGASGDLTWNATTKTLGSTLLDFTTLGLTVGQFIHVGGLTVTNQFAAGVLYGRIVSITATAIVLDKIVGTLTITDAGTGKLIDILFGRFLRNVAVDHASFIERSFQFEAAYAGLNNPSGDKYEYSKGNLANTMELNLPLTDKATVTFGFVGTDTDVPTATRKTNAATPVLPVQTVAYNTTSDITRLRITQVDEDGLTTCFKEVTLTLNNNVSPEKCLGVLGASYMNTGNFEVDLEAQVLFTQSEVVDAIRNNETVTMEFILTNDDGGIAIDLPAMTLGDGSKEFPVNESVLINLSGEAFAHPTLGYSIGISLFPVLP
jgi:hypothetical protein